MRIRWLLASLLVPFATVGANQVLNPDFDTGVQNWGFRLSAGGGTVTWDSTVGYPTPGSASAGNVFVDAAVDGWAQCVPVNSADFAFTTAVASALQAGNSCRITLDFIKLADCVNETPIALEVVMSNTRNDGSFETLSAGGTLPHDVQAVAVFLDHVRVDGALIGNSYCHFDHVELAADTVFAAGFD